MLYVEVNENGAELSSLFSKKSKTEFLWQGNPAIWGQRAPVLFPIVGRLKDGKYEYGGKSYEMPSHGFASKSVFSAETTEDGSLILSMSDDKESRAMYPFSFVFRVIFTLKWNVLETIYQVENKTNGPMYFSFGSHEGYRCPRMPGESFDDYYIEFDHDNVYKCWTVSPNGLLTEPLEPRIDGGKRLQLNYGLFENDSLVFSDVPSGKISLGTNKSQTRVEIEYDDAPNVLIWTKAGAPYVCIEPWYGLPDFEDSSGDFTSKRGIISLEKGASFDWRHTISIYEAR